MPNRVISTYWRVIKAAKASLPPEEDVIKCAFHLGRAFNEMKKGFNSLGKNKSAKEGKGQPPRRIKIE